MSWIGVNEKEANIEMENRKLENAQPGILFIRENIIYKLKC